MLKVRYNTETGLLSGWADSKAEAKTLIAREGENVAILDSAKPDADDYEYFIYLEGQLFPSSKKMPRDLGAEIDELKARIEKLESR